MSELNDRLNRLAARGNRRGADDVLAAAMRDVPDVAPEATNVDGDLEIFDDDAPFVMPDSDSGRHRRGRYGTLVATFGAAALLGVGVLAVTAMFGNGGAGSPEGAVRQLADSITQKDPLAAVDVLVPSEVRSMRESVNGVTHRAADLKIVDQASQPLAGVDLSVSNLQLSSQPLADGYAKVTITGGNLSTGTHQAAMSQLLRDAFRNSDTSDTKSSVELAKLASSSDLPTFVVTVRHNGGWYVSPAYTALEYAREANGGPAAEFGSAPAAKLGADSPELAVSDALHALQAGNWDRLIALAPPDELPVYDYRAWIKQEAADTHPDFTIDKLSTNATVSGDTATVKLEASGMSGSGESRGKWQVGGACPAYGSGWSSYDPASEGGATGVSATDGVGMSMCLSGNVGGIVPFGLMSVEGQPETQSSGPISIQAVREDGRWFVSPVATALDAVNNFVDRFDERSLYPLIGLGYKLPPDGNITLNQPFTVNGGELTHVYAFDGTQGQSVVGEVEGTSRYTYASGQLYTADGRDVGYVDFAPKDAGYGASTTELPTTGSYRLVVSQGPLPKGTTLTLFDTAHAPKSLTNPDPSGSPLDEVCTRTANGESCTYSGSATPTPATIAPLPAPESGCGRQSGMVTCSSQSSGVATTSVP